MNPTPEQREIIRLSILRYTQVNALSLAITRAYLGAEGFILSREAVAAEIQYLKDKKLLVADEKAVSPEVKLYRATADGRDYLATQGQE